MKFVHIINKYIFKLGNFFKEALSPYPKAKIKILYKSRTNIICKFK